MGFPLPKDAADPRFHTFFDYWCSKAPEGKLPGRQHIDPSELRALLPNILIYDVVRVDGRYRFRYRLWGSFVTQLVGADFTGKFIEDAAEPERHADINSVLSAIVTSRQPHFWQQPVPVPNRDFIAYQRLALPLARDGETVDMLFCLLLPVSNSTPER